MVQDTITLPESNAHAQDERELLLGLIFGAIQDREITPAADFAARIAICARMAAGNQVEYGRYVKRLLIRNEKILEVFSDSESHRAVLQFLRAIRNSRNDEKTLEWLATHFMEPQEAETVRTYLIAVERVLANALMERSC